MSDRSVSKSRSRSPDRDHSPVPRSASRSRSPVRSVSKDDSPRRLSRSVTPRRASRSRSRSRGQGGDWKRTLDGLIDRGDISSRDLDTRTMDALEDLAADLGDDAALAAVDRFAEANFSRITNKSGFLMGIIRRVQEDGPNRGNVDLDILPRSVRYRLKDVIDEGRINKLDIDARMLKALADLPVDLGIEAIDKFAMASLDSIRSKTGFMMGIIKRIQEDLSGRYRDPYPRDRGYSGGGGYGRDRYDRGGGGYDRNDRGYGGGSRYGGGGGGGGGGGNYGRY
ncbi:hypothetical protein CVIRNUC_010733 [Coccomyxa viridis]|uniref:Heterogeneous nuclear ribonucleoprotein Q acidic domain-containing protein n=1 Tax=Coccomyxa viridis TaxID=1274662 RepID=A0AAV1IN94_9CHLO|nr:hypothetical protein CVIRNUC_010733 [Coccomyxa viridis]